MPTHDENNNLLTPAEKQKKLYEAATKGNKKEVAALLAEGVVFDFQNPNYGIDDVKNDDIRQLLFHIFFNPAALLKFELDRDIILPGENGEEDITIPAANLNVRIPLKDLKNKKLLGKGVKGTAFRCEFDPELLRVAALDQELSENQLQTLRKQCIPEVLKFCTVEKDDNNQPHYWMAVKTPQAEPILWEKFNPDIDRVIDEFLTEKEQGSEISARHFQNTTQPTEEASYNVTQGAWISIRTQRGQEHLPATVGRLETYDQTQKGQPKAASLESYLEKIVARTSGPLKENATEKTREYVSAFNNDLDIILLQFIAKAYAAIKAFHANTEHIHRDVRLPNLFLGKVEMEDGVPVGFNIKLGDAGLAIEFNPELFYTEYLADGSLLPMAHMNREQVIHYQTKEGKLFFFSPTSDFYSFRISLLEILVPFINQNSHGNFYNNETILNNEPLPVKGTSRAKHIATQLEKTSEEEALRSYVANFDSREKDGILFNPGIKQSARQQAHQLLTLFKDYLTHIPNYEIESPENSLPIYPSAEKIQDTLAEEHKLFAATMQTAFEQTLIDKLARYETDINRDTLRLLLISIKRLANIPGIDVKWSAFRKFAAFSLVDSEIVSQIADIHAAVSELKEQISSDKTIFKALGELDERIAKFGQHLEQAARHRHSINTQVDELSLTQKLQELKANGNADIQAAIEKRKERIDLLFNVANKIKGVALVDTFVEPEVTHESTTQSEQENETAGAEISDNSQILTIPDATTNETNATDIGGEKIEQAVAVPAEEQKDSPVNAEADKVKDPASVTLKEKFTISVKIIAANEEMDSIIATAHAFAPLSSSPLSHWRRSTRSSLKKAEKIIPENNLAKINSTIQSLENQLKTLLSNIKEYQSLAVTMDAIDSIVALQDDDKASEKITSKEIEQIFTDLEIDRKVSRKILRLSSTEPFDKRIAALLATKKTLENTIQALYKRKLFLESPEKIQKQIIAIEKVMFEANSIIKKLERYQEARQLDDSLDKARKDAIAEISKQFDPLQSHKSQLHLKNPDGRLSAEALRNRIQYLDDIIQSSTTILKIRHNPMEGDTTAIKLLTALKVKTSKALELQRAYEQEINLSKIQPVFTPPNIPVAKDQKDAEKLQRKLLSAISELYTNEETFITTVGYFVDFFLTKDGSLKPDNEIMKDGGQLSEEERLMIFYFLQPYFTISKMTKPPVPFVEGNVDMDAALKQWEEYFKQTHYFAAMRLATQNYSSFSALIKKIRGENAFEAIFKNPIHGQSPDVETYLILPIQRLMRYDLTLKEVQSNTVNQTHFDQVTALRTHSISMARLANDEQDPLPECPLYLHQRYDSTIRKDQREKVQSIAASFKKHINVLMKLPPDSNITSQTRDLVKAISEGFVTKVFKLVDEKDMPSAQAMIEATSLLSILTEKENFSDMLAVIAAKKIASPVFAEIFSTELSKLEQALQQADVVSKKDVEPEPVPAQETEKASDTTPAENNMEARNPNILTIPAAEEAQEERTKKTGEEILHHKTMLAFLDEFILMLDEVMSKSEELEEQHPILKANHASFFHHTPETDKSKKTDREEETPHPDHKY